MSGNFKYVKTIYRTFSFSNCANAITFNRSCVHKLRPVFAFSTARLSSTSKKVPFEEQPKNFNPKKILLLRKITRYEYEKTLRPDKSEADLKDYVSIQLFVY